MASTKAQIRASVEYNKNRDNIMVRPTKEDGAVIRAAAAKAGQSVQAYVLQAVRERMEREQAPRGGFRISEQPTDSNIHE